MKRFQFRLERVKKVKELLEEKARNAWVVANNHYLQEQEQLNELHRERADVLAYGYRLDDPVLRSAMYHYLQRMDRRITEQEHQVQQAKEAVTKAREEWLQAQKEAEVLNTLREKQLEQHVLEMEREEQKLIDELGLSKSLASQPGLMS